ncbi:gluconate 2-dehydrogenase subunit 3 family protein [Fulvivirga sp. M361]|uniref:gluconate 2-dehydrogenase subunit 3 family protein n=1 Tax=Fulvivirga sp. M361 TaxID=2594266 RepID=UPI0016252F21|nr:gluconate 2-dehydrogenase subunit 3 family protein [Fulvivirga sp. M361]
MNRRKALVGITSGGLGLVFFSGYKWYDWNRKPNLEQLQGKQEMINELAELIIPGTDTPGAIEAQVGKVVVDLITSCADRKTQNRFMNGLIDLEKKALALHGKNFPECSNEEKHGLLTEVENHDMKLDGFIGKASKKMFGKSFFRTLRDYTSIAFCTSELGASKSLNYVLVPGKYMGCIPLEKDQPSWTTE